MTAVNHSPDAAMLVRRLNSSAKVIQALLKSGGSSGSNTSASADSIIERKLAQLEELVLTIPETNSTLLAEWEDKVVALWKAHAAGRSLPDKEESLRCSKDDDLPKNGSKQQQQVLQPSYAASETSSTESMHISIVKNTPNAGISILELAGGNKAEAAVVADPAEALFIQELTSLEVTIKELLTQRPVSLRLMQRQLTLLLGTMTRIPKCYEELYREWNLRVGALMAQFAALAEPGRQKEGATVVVAEDPKKKSYSDWKPSSSASEGNVKQAKRSQLPPPPPRELVESKLRAAFDRFPDQSVTGGPPLSQLFYLAAKAFKLTKPVHREDVAFGVRIFDLAFSKLHPSLADGFFTNPNVANQKRLIDLCGFLSRSIQMDQAPMGKGFEQLRCRFCGVQGHNADNCVRIINRLCYSCFEKGHEWSSCPNHTLTAEELLDSL